MDVPAWHPANEDAALVRQRMLAGRTDTPARTEFKVMAGSQPDTSTEAGRLLVNEFSRGGGGGDSAVPLAGRGFFDASDRLYIEEQNRLAAEQSQLEREAKDAELESFRARARKVQAQKATLTVATTLAPAVVGSIRKSEGDAQAKPIVVIKPKKRSVDKEAGGRVKKLMRSSPQETSEKKMTKKKLKQKKTAESTAKTKSEENAPATTRDGGSDTGKKPPLPAANSLLLGYSCSSESEQEEAHQVVR